MILCWAVDFSNIGGEGSLSRAYVSRVLNYYNQKIVVITPQKIYLLKQKRILSIKRNNVSSTPMQESKNLFSQRFFYPLIGSWLLFRNKKKFKKRIYLNYVPLWLFPLFLISKIGSFELGPVVGGIFYWRKERNLTGNLFRVKFMKFFYRLSIFIIRLFKIRITSSSRSLYKYLKFHNVKVSAHSINLLSYDKKPTNNQENEREYDFILYYRKHQSKYPNFTSTLAKALHNSGYKVCTYGEIIEDSPIDQKGYIKKKKLLKIFSNTKIFINIADNPENLSVFDAISNGCLVLNITESSYNQDDGVYLCNKLEDIQKFAECTILRDIKLNKINYKKINKSILQKRKEVKKNIERYFLSLQ